VGRRVKTVAARDSAGATLPVYMAAFLNYISYPGALTVIIIVEPVSARTFDDPVKLILPPSVYFLLSLLGGNCLMS